MGNRIPMDIEVLSSGDKISIKGLFIYKNYLQGEESARHFLETYHKSGAFPFDDCIGVYYASVVLNDGRSIYFTDNYGGVTFFINWKQGKLYGTLRESCEKEHVIPDYYGIAQFLYLGCIYSDDTIIKGVSRSNPNYYYVKCRSKIEKYSKNLTPFEKMEKDPDALEHLMKRVCAATKNISLGCTITGGIDSRTILSHLIANHVHPKLTITGKLSDADVCIARQIAKLISEELYVFSDKVEDTDWLELAIRESDGMDGPCGIYRLLKQRNGLSERGIMLKFGGVAGELYKNSFINQDYPFYFGKPNWNRFLKMKLIPFEFPKGICAGRTQEEIKNLYPRFIKYLQKNSDESKRKAYLRFGYRILQCRMAGVSNMENRGCWAYNPLMERAVVASVFNLSPYLLEMQAWQRRQVTIMCPLLKDIQTDRGLTCNSARVMVEWIKSTSYLVKVGLKRIFGRSEVIGRIDSCFEQGLSSTAYYSAVCICKELAILAPEVEPEQIPGSIADRILAIGAFFDCKKRGQ